MIAAKSTSLASFFGVIVVSLSWLMSYQFSGLLQPVVPAEVSVSSRDRPSLIGTCAKVVAPKYDFFFGPAR
jgi:hypothetical protein